MLVRPDLGRAAPAQARVACLLRPPRRRHLPVAEERREVPATAAQLWPSGAADNGGSTARDRHYRALHAMAFARARCRPVFSKVALEASRTAGRGGGPFPPATGTFHVLGPDA